MKRDLCGFPEDAVHASRHWRSVDQYDGPGIPVFRYRTLFRAVGTDESTAFFDPRLNRTSSLPDVHLPTLAGHVYIWLF
jgi:hypothetical protein